MICAKKVLESFAYSDYFLYLLIGIILVVAYVAWKLIFGKIDENCWFCNSNNLVPYKLKNRWTCIHCGQYNGFDKTGDYNKELPEMYDSSYNIRQIAVQSMGDTKAQLHQQTKLCEKCSCNQLLIYKQLAQFRPIQESNFEFEVDEYKKKLEKLYALCSMCQHSCQRYIKLQDTILRGSMLQHRLNHTRAEQNVKVNHKKIIQPRKRTAIMFQLFMLALVMTYSLVSFCNFARDVCVAHFLKFEKTFLSTLGGYIVTASLALSIAMLCFKNVPHRRTGFIYVILWLACAPNLLAPRKNEFKRDHVYKLINLYSNNLLEIQAYNENLLHNLIFSATTLNFMSCFVLYLFCLINLMLLATMTNTQFNEEMGHHRHVAVNAELAMSNKTHEELFSDEESEESMDIKDEVSGKQAREIELNGSLNALKLQDGENFDALLNSLNNSNAVLPSALHTPPPSRSSSLLSLASHHSISSSNHLTNKNLSSINFARPSTELPFRKYNSHSTTHCWSNSPSLAPRSVASFRQNSYRPRLTMSLPGGKFQKPLISPAKLQWLASKSRHSSVRSMKNVKPDSEAEVSFYDSVSQAGDLGYPEVSDNDDDITSTPLKHHRTINSNTSSPKSTISNITSVTMQSVAEMENSRCCRWILAICLLANLVLVVLLVMEVKEMREMEKWKSQTAL